MLKKILSIICIISTILSVMTFYSHSMTVDAAVEQNWNTFAIKYTPRTKLPITVKQSDGTRIPKTDGFVFDINANNGIDMDMPTYEEFVGAYGASVVTSKYKTELDSLTVNIDADNFDFAIDPLSITNTIGILWSEDEIPDLGNLTTGDSTAFNGIRELIPNKRETDGFVMGIPANAAPVDEITGKALYIGITNRNGVGNADKLATRVDIVYFDGHYINKADTHVGYRWIFISGDTSEPLSDDGMPSYDYPAIDLTKNLKLEIKADNELGYKVCINGVEYYEGAKVDYFPQADIYGYGYEYLTQDDYDNMTEAYLTSMTYAEKDIDLSGLKNADKGHLTIGVTGINDYKMEHGSDIVVNSVNGIPAALWKGERNDIHNTWKVSAEDLRASEIFGEDEALCEIEYFDDGGLLVKDASALKDDACTYENITKVTSENKLQLNGFSMDITPLASQKGKYPEALSLSLSNLYEKYDNASEHSMGSAADISAFYGIPEDEYYRTGTYYKFPDSVERGDAENEYTLIFTLLEYATINGDPCKGSVEDDGFYDTVYWCVMSQGNYLDGRAVSLLEPIKQGDKIEIEILYNEFDGKQDIYLMVNDEMINLTACNDSQYQTQEYYFSLSAYTPDLEGDGSSSFVINSIAGGKLTDFCGWKDIHNCADIFDEKSLRYIGYSKEKAEWVILKEPGEGIEGLKAVECPYCDGYSVTEIIPAIYTPQATAEYTVITVDKLNDVKDFFIAKGECESYAEVKANLVVHVSENKIGTKTSYSYQVPEEGVYTVCIRYDNTGRDHSFISVEAQKHETLFKEKGLLLNINGAPSNQIKAVRTAYGDYNSGGEIKRAEGSRSFNYETLRSNDFDILYRKEGLVSVSVTYTDGYEVIYKFNAQRKIPEVIKQGKSVTFNNIQYFDTIRYARGVHESVKSIKATPKNQVITPSNTKIDTTTVTFYPYETDTFTFCVQYLDGTQNFFVISFEE